MIFVARHNLRSPEFEGGDHVGATVTVEVARLDCVGLALVDGPWRNARKDGRARKAGDGPEPGVLRVHHDIKGPVEVEVRGNVIKHKIDGKVVLEYTDPQLDPKDADAKRLLDAGADLHITSGTISLQSESHPIEFRKVELKRLAE